MYTGMQSKEDAVRIHPTMMVHAGYLYSPCNISSLPSSEKMKMTCKHRKILTCEEFMGKVVSNGKCH
jgi:hypothetical protein